MANEVPNALLGHQLDANTLALYKMGDTDLGQHGDAAVDAAGNNDLLSVGNPAIAWGPAQNTQRETFARWFPGSGTSLERLTSAVLGSSNPLREQIVNGGGEYTVEVLARIDIDFVGDTFGLINIMGAAAGETAADDVLVRLDTDSNAGTFDVVWESTGANQSIAVSTGAPFYSPGEWFVVHIVFSDRSGDSTRWDVNFYFSQVGSLGTLLGTFDDGGDFAEGDGLKPISTSGTNATVTIGGIAGFQGIFGAVGSARVVDRVMTTVEIEAAASELLTTGDVTDSLTTVGHWRLNERPDYVDESIHGFHLREINTANRFDGTRGLDIVGTGGIARRGVNAITKHDIDTINFAVTHGRPLRHFFTDDVDAVPEYTMEAWLTFPSQGIGTGTYIAWGWGPGGSSSSSNALFRYFISAGTDFNVGFFGEHSAGTNIAQSPALTKIVNTSGNETESSGRIHWAARVTDDAGTYTIEHFINGTLRSTHTIPTTPNGGLGNLRDGFFCNWDGYIQEIKISKGALSDTAILNDANRCGLASGDSPDLVPPTFSLTSPASGSQLAKNTRIVFDVADVTPGIRITGVWVKYKFDNQRMLVYDGTQFQFPFSAFSTITDVNSDSTLLTFSLLPTGGWLGEIEQLQVRVGDGGGNIDFGVSDGIFFLAP